MTKKRIEKQLEELKRRIEKHKEDRKTLDRQLSLFLTAVFVCSMFSAAILFFLREKFL